MLTACTKTEMTVGSMNFRRTSFLQRVNVPNLQVSSNGVITLNGYDTDGGAETMGAVLGTALGIALKAAK